MQVQPYLFFEGRCDEALDFYRKTLGAEVVTLLRFRESPQPGMVTPGTEDRVMHAVLRVGDATVMASDGRCAGQPRFEGFSLSITLKDETPANKMFAALSEGGHVVMPLEKTFWSPRFGMVTDRFGVTWMINVSPS